MQRREDLLVDALYRHRPDVIVAAGLQDALRVGTVCLVASDVGPNVVRREQHHAVAELFNLPRPVVGGSARFHDHGRRGLLRNEGQELGSREPYTARDVTGSVRDRQLENGLCHVYGDASIV